MTVQCPEPGVYENVPFDTYVSWPALNHSTLRHMRRSPMHFKHQREIAKHESPAMMFGTGVHAFLLERHQFMSRCVPAPINEKTGKTYGSDTKAWAEYAAKYPGKMIVSTEDMEAFGLIWTRLNECESTKAIITAAGKSEVCIVWDDAITGLRCKGRVDRLVPGFGRVDVKTTASAEPGDFRSSIINYGYHTQEAFYARGCKALKLPPEPGVLLVIESGAPHACALYEIGEDTLRVADSIVADWLLSVKQCTDRNNWPGYTADRVETLDAPEWWFKKFQNGDEA